MTVIQAAHGIGGRADLPTPLWLTLYAGGVAVIVTFLALLAFWTRQRFRTRTSPPTDERGSSAAVLPRVAGLLLGAAFLAVAVAGPADSARNATSTWFFVWFWVGLAPVSALFGRVWKAMNPLRTLASAARLTVYRSHPRPLPAALGVWPAAATLAGFLWMELVYDHADRPDSILVFLALYTLIGLVGGLVYGDTWFDHGDGFQVYSNFFAHLSPIHRTDIGKLALRNPLRNLATFTPQPGHVAFICLILGSTAYDGLSRHQFWLDLTQPMGRQSRMLLGTAGLIVTVIVVLATYTVAAQATRHHLAPTTTRLDQQFAHSLLPIALGYSIAHYFSFAVFQGQAGYLLASDPFGRGWDLLGLTNTTINYTIVGTSTIALVQIGGIVLGHIIAVVAAHDRALGVFPANRRMNGQYPLLATMVGYTVGGLVLVAGT